MFLSTIKKYINRIFQNNILNKYLINLFILKSIFNKIFYPKRATIHGVFKNRKYVQ